MSQTFQRLGSISNAYVGQSFEDDVKLFFEAQNLSLARDFKVNLGVHLLKKPRKFDLGSADPPIIIECKSHRWTGGQNIPSAKITVWNESMYYFHMAPHEFRKLFVVARAFCVRRRCTLAEHYVRNFRHLIPSDVEIWEFNEDKKTAERMEL